jgi:hypothetical protein
MRDQPSPEALAFLADANAGVAKAQADCLAAGVPIVYTDEAGRYVREYPDGRIMEIRFHPGETGSKHAEELRQVGRRAH